MLAWCSLLRAPGVGIKTYLKLLAVCESPEVFFALSERDLQKRLPDVAVGKIRAWREAEGSGAADMAWYAPDEGRHILTLQDDFYPQNLRAIDDPPPVLFIQGEPALLSAAQIAMVGSRNATVPALQTTHGFARELAGRGWVITSGMALGIDGEAHRGALDAGGLTIAVVGTGLDRVYPAQHRDLAHRIVRQGAIVSEFPLGTGVRGDHFPRRNRIISGLAAGVLVVEASLQSGSLITARLALEQGREVFAIPGSIHHPLAKGCHLLIKQGAKLTENVDDIVEELPPLQAIDMTESVARHVESHEESEVASVTADTVAEDHVDDAHTQTVLTAMGFAPCSLDDLVARTELTGAEISAILLMLELDGRIAVLPGQRFQRL